MFLFVQEKMVNSATCSAYYCINANFIFVVVNKPFAHYMYIVISHELKKAIHKTFSVMFCAILMVDMGFIIYSFYWLLS